MDGLQIYVFFQVELFQAVVWNIQLFQAIIVPHIKFFEFATVYH